MAALRVCSIFVIGLLVATAAHARHGGDVSDPVDQDTFSCCVQNGWGFVIVRSYLSLGTPDANAPATLAAAAAAGIPYRDIYHFVCAGQGALEQLNASVANVGKGNFGMLWLDIEMNPSPGCGWNSDTSINCGFLGQFIAAGNTLGLSLGVYSSQDEWANIMGACTAAADAAIPLWYATPDGAANFSDFSPFGGWTTPNIKQYADSVSFCGVGADADWYPTN